MNKNTDKNNNLDYYEENNKPKDDPANTNGTDENCLQSDAQQCVRFTCIKWSLRLTQ